MKKITVTILSIALVAMGAIFVFGQTAEKPTEGKSFGKHHKFGKFGKRGKRGKRMMGRLFRQLDLTDEQKAQMKEIKQASREKVQPLRQQMRENRQQLRQATENGNFDEATVTAIAAQQGQIHAQLIVEKQKVKTQMYNVLTTEQKNKLAELKAQFKQKMEERKAFWAEKKAQKESQ